MLYENVKPTINLFIFCLPVVNPCLEQTDSCAPHATCVFSGVSYEYTCMCGEGWRGDGYSECIGRYLIN